MRPTKASPTARAVAAYGLDSHLTLPDRPLMLHDFLELMVECQQHRVLGLLARAVDDGSFPVDDDQRRHLTQLVRSWHANVVRAEQQLVRATEALTAEGIEHRVLKGAALAHTVYPDPAWRLFGDVDVLVRPDRFGEAARLLADHLGAERAEPERRPGFDERFGREILLRIGGIELDLHRTLIDGVYGMRLDLNDLFEPPTPFHVGGHGLSGLGPTTRFLHACFAAVLGNTTPRLASQRDVAQLVVSDSVDFERVRVTATRSRCTGIVSLALQESAVALGFQVPSRDAPSERVTPADRLFVACYRNRFAGPLSHATGLVALHRYRDRWSYGWAFVPSRRREESA